MSHSSLTQEEYSQRYAIAIEACWEIAHTYFFLGRVTHAHHVLRMMLQLIEGSEATPHDRLKLLLLYGQILTKDHFLNDTDATLMFDPLEQAKQIAASIQDQQALADALSLLGQAHYFATLVARVKSGAPLDSADDGEAYHEAHAHHQQALALREALHESRGMSESHFYVGIVCERQQKRELAAEHHATALHIAEQAGLLLERCEPTRHLAGLAFEEGRLDRALTSALQALSLREIAGFRPSLPFDHLLLSEIYQARGDVANALRHAHIAASLAAESESTRARSLADARLRQFDRQ